MHRPVWDTVIIVEEVNLSHPQFPYCYMMVQWKVLKGRHPNIDQCAKGG